MQRKFISSLVLLLFLNILIKPLWIFGIDLEVQNRVGASAYGIYAAVFSFTMVFNVLLDLGLTQYNNRAIAQNPTEVARNFSKLTSLKLFLGIFYLLVTLLIGYFLGYTVHVFWLLLILSINQFMASFLLFLRSHLAGLHLFKSDSILSVLDKILMILSCGILLFTPVLKMDFNIIHFALAQLGSYVAVVGIGFVMVRKKARIFKWSINYQRFRKDLRNSLPYALLIMLMALYTRIDSIMLEQISGSFEAGIYAQAFRLLDAVNQFAYLVGLLLLSIFARMFAEKQDVEPITKLSFSLIIAGTLAVSLSTGFAAPGLLSALYVEHSELSTPVFRILIGSSVAFGATYVFGTLLTARGNLRVLNMVALGGFVLNLILNFVLIPLYGATGAASATIFTQFATAAVQLGLSFRLAGISFKNTYWAQLVLFAGAAYLACLVIDELEASWYLRAGAGFVAVLLLSVLFRLFNLKAAIDLLRTRFR